MNKALYQTINNGNANSSAVKKRKIADGLAKSIQEISLPTPPRKIIRLMKYKDFNTAANLALQLKLLAVTATQPGDSRPVLSA